MHVGEGSQVISHLFEVCTFLFDFIGKPIEPAFLGAGQGGGPFECGSILVPLVFQCGDVVVQLLFHLLMPQLFTGKHLAVMLALGKNDTGHGGKNET